ncbi:hypothetical protein LguiB_030849 [Lonicera macranthoides]
MDYLTQFLAILGLLALFLTFGFRKTTKNAAPGPSGAWPIIGHLHLLRGKDPVARTLGAMADKHGPIFSLQLGSCPAIVVSGWEIAKECFTTNDKTFASRPSMAIAKYLSYENAGFALAPYGPYWREVRKMVTLTLFTNHQLEKLKHIRATEVDCSVKDLHLKCSKDGEVPTEVAINKWIEDLTMDISIRMLVGKRFSREGEGGETWRFKQAAKQALYLGGTFVVSDVIPSIEWLDIGGHVKSMKQTAKELDRVIGKWLEEHIQKRNVCGVEGGRDSDGDEDFMDVMLSSLAKDAIVSDHKHDNIIKATTLFPGIRTSDVYLGLKWASVVCLGPQKYSSTFATRKTGRFFELIGRYLQSLPIKPLQNEILILTGSESTADTLIWALSLLLNNRHALKTVQDELDAKVGRNKWVEESDISNLTYLQAVVKETLRLYPPGPLAGPHLATEDCNICGYHVPKGTRLIVNLWKLHRDPRVWSNPCEFQPGRFLKEHTGVNFSGQNFEYIPFSSGRRMCPATTFALQVINLALARLLQGYDILTPKGMPVDMREGLGIALPKVEPLQVIITPRLPSELYQ